LVTRCTTADEFIARFARFTTEHDVVVPALPQVTVSSTGPFAIYLKDLTVMMKGRCEVTEIRPVSSGADGEKSGSVRALMRLHLREMDAHSCGIHLRLMERHAATAAAKPAPPPEAVPVDAPPAADATADVSTGMVVAEERSQTDTETTTVSPTPTEQRVPGAALMLPANPLGDLDAADLASFVELGLDQEHHRPPLRARLARIPRKTRRVAAYASCAIVGLVLGIVISPGSKAAPVVRVASVVPAPAPVAPAPPPPPPEPAAPPEAPDDPLPTATRKHSHRTVVVERVKRTRTVKTVRTRTQRHSRVVQRSH
jgi:hypothetical protein